jgi:hypothetical protein
VEWLKVKALSSSPSTVGEKKKTLFPDPGPERTACCVASHSGLHSYSGPREAAARWDQLHLLSTVVGCSRAGHGLCHLHSRCDISRSIEEEMEVLGGDETC